MPIWAEILRELNLSAAAGEPSDFDGVSRRYLVALRQHTGRAWHSRPLAPRIAVHGARRAVIRGRSAA